MRVVDLNAPAVPTARIAIPGRIGPLAINARTNRIYVMSDQIPGAAITVIDGASNAIAMLSSQERSRGVVAASTGNHGRALAHAAKLEGMRAVICMSKLVPENKLDAIRRLGADIRIVGNSQDDAQQEVDRLVAEERLVVLPPFDHPDIIAGQGTLGLEIMEQVPDAAAVLVPLSGGGLAFQRRWPEATHRVLEGVKRGI